MSNVTTSICAIGLNTAKALGLPYEVLDQTTLNEKFNVLPERTLPEGEYPITKFVAIGRGGHRNAAGSDNRSITILEKHRSRDKALFEHIPFILREQDDDLTTEQRKHYAMRTLVVIEDVTYIAYYLKILDLTSQTVEYNRVTITNGEEVSVPYVPSSAELSPTPMVLNNQSVNVSNGEFITASTLINCDFNEWEVAEILNACRIIYGEENYATLSEVALCSGYPIQHTAQNPNQPQFTYTESICTQVHTMVTTRHELWETNLGIPFSFNVGGSESDSL